MSASPLLCTRQNHPQPPPQQECADSFAAPVAQDVRIVTTAWREAALGAGWPETASAKDATLATVKKVSHANHAFTVTDGKYVAFSAISQEAPGFLRRRQWMKVAFYIKETLGCGHLLSLPLQNGPHKATFDIFGLVSPDINSRQFVWTHCCYLNYNNLLLSCTQNSSEGINCNSEIIIIF